MLKALRKRIGKLKTGGGGGKVKPSNEKLFLVRMDYMETLEALWVAQPNNRQGALVYETTFQAGGYTSFVTVPSGHCFASPARCRSPHNSRQQAARVALTHCMFDNDILFSRPPTPRSPSAVTEIVRSDSISDIKVDAEDSFSALSYVLSNNSQHFGADRFLLLLKLKLMHWNGNFRYTDQQMWSEVARLPLERLCESMALDWCQRERERPGVVSMELAKCRQRLLHATRTQKNVRLHKEKCIILLSAMDLLHTFQ